MTPSASSMKAALEFMKEWELGNKSTEDGQHVMSEALALFRDRAKQEEREACATAAAKAAEWNKQTSDIVEAIRTRTSD